MEAQRVRKFPAKKPFQKWEDTLIWDLWDSISARAIAKRLKRSDSGICNRAYELGLPRKNDRDDRPWFGPSWAEQMNGQRFEDVQFKEKPPVCANAPEGSSFANKGE